MGTGQDVNAGPGRSTLAELRALVAPADRAAIERHIANYPPLTADQRAIILALYRRPKPPQ